MTESASPLTARTDREILDATRAFAVDDTRTSVLALVTTLGLLACLLALAAFAHSSLVRAAASIVAGLTIVRMFILYHDHMHGALLRRSRLARAVFATYGVLALTPPRVWRETHNYHHAHNAKIVGSNVGSFAMVTTGMWSRMSARDRVIYRAVRHPLTIVLGYFTIFLFGMCVAPFVRSPKKNWDSALAIVVHIALAALLVHAAGWAMFFYVLFAPLFVATAAGGYLFYAQHNFPGVYLQPRESWTYVRAALESSSYLETGPIMAFFTGNIGFHHVHHLNPMIPFYRLPQAMRAIPELQHPHTTTLAPRDIAACLRLKMWDMQEKRMVGYPRSSEWPTSLRSREADVTPRSPS